MLELNAAQGGEKKTWVSLINSELTSTYSPSEIVTDAHPPLEGARAAQLLERLQDTTTASMVTQHIEAQDSIVSGKYG